MRHNAKRKMQAGFTLIELIVVIVIVGILAAVAIPKFSDTTVAARTAVQDATLGALKSAWASVYANKKGATPTATEVAAAMADPACTVTVASGDTTCAGVTKDDGTGQAVFSLGAGGDITTPASITIKTH